MNIQKIIPAFRMRSLCFRAAVLTILFTVFSSAAAFAGMSPLISRDGFYFDTIINIAMYDTDDETILNDCFDAMAYYESIFSRTVEGSDVWNINHSQGQPTAVADETIDIITQALHYCELSDGALDITIAPVVSLWDFHEDSAKELPAEDVLAEALKHVDYRNIKIDGNTVTLTDPEASIDLGAIAKGYISDRVKDILTAHGCSHALINLGGNVMAVGRKPDDSVFKIGIRKPFGVTSADLIAVVDVDDFSVITSGTYERYFELDGKVYHHILDPATGYSVDNELTSVSILSPCGTDGDALSTTCFALGSEKGMELIESLEGIEAMFIDQDLNITYSSGWPQ